MIPSVEAPWEEEGAPVRGRAFAPTPAGPTVAPGGVGELGTIAGQNAGRPSRSGRVLRAGWVALAWLCLAVTPVSGQAERAQREGPGSLSWTLRFLSGGAAGLAIHEGGHLAFDLGFHAHPRTKRISFAGIPFFNIDHDVVSRRKTYVIAAAGLWAQGLSAEWILTRDPDLRSRSAPFKKGVFAFHIATSLIYSGAAFGRIGPEGRDTFGMARSLGSDGIAEPWAGTFFFAPAVLDAYRYFHPEAKWAVWASRVTKVAPMLLTLAAR